ncbi:MAG: hypothetical protein JWM27_5032 [Gemmatimonadetes bacterium]|nr:hypothetical protein [Gemmatimonadota bacterium]
MSFMAAFTRRSLKFRVLAVLAGLTGAALLLAAGAAQRRNARLANLTVGQHAPAFTAVDTRGQAHTLAGYAGKWVVMEWFNHDCPYTKKHYALVNGVGNTQAMQQEYTRRGVIWLSIVSSAPGKQGFTTAAEADRRTREKGAAPTAVIRDTAGVLGEAYGARNTPQYAIIDPNGVLRYSGAIDDQRTSSVKDVAGATNYVRAALDAALAGRPIAVSRTQPYGCAVKY